MRYPPPLTSSKLPQMFGKQAPADPLSEMAFLGCALIEPANIPDMRRLVKLEDFYDDRHSRIYVALLDVHDRTRDIDLVTLQAELNRSAGDGEEINVSYLDELMEGVPSAVAYPHYAKLVTEKAKLRRFIATLSDGIYAAYHRPEDAGTVIAGTFERLAALSRDAGSQAPMTLARASEMVIESLEKGDPANLRTGFEDFDGIAGGIPRSGVWTIFGYPGGGKSTFALACALNLSRGLPATKDRPAQPRTVVRYYSVEQSPIRAAATLLSQGSGLGVHGMLNSGNATDAQIGAIADARLRVASGDFAFFENSMDPNQLFAECAALATKHSHGVLVVDYIQDLPPFGQFIDSTPRISESMRILARIARELGWLVICVSQLDKNASKMNQSPKMTDGLGSSAIDQRSDFMSYVWRPHQREVAPPRDYGQDAFGMNVTSEAWTAWYARFQRVCLGVLKNKYGRSGIAEMQFEPKPMRFVRPPHEISQHWMEIKE